MTQEEIENQVLMARYIQHKICVTRYIEAVGRGEVDMPTAAEQYRRAMENYDSLMAQATAGTFSEAEQISMDAGFPREFPSG